MNAFGISIRELLEAAVAFGVIWAQLRSCRSSLRGQGRRIGKLEQRVTKLEARGDGR